MNIRHNAARYYKADEIASPPPPKVTRSQPPRVEKTLTERRCLCCGAPESKVQH